MDRIIVKTLADMQGDLISREAALKALKGVIARTGLYGVSIEVILETIPPAEVELVGHAHWIKLHPTERDFFTDYTHKCSKCSAWGKKHYKYCRECGAVMDEKVFEPTPLLRLDLGGRINKRLIQMGITTVEQLEALDKHTLHNISGLGRKSIETIETELRIWSETKENTDGCSRS